jgi:hypothetical protein
VRMASRPASALRSSAIADRGIAFWVVGLVSRYVGSRRFLTVNLSAASPLPTRANDRRQNSALRWIEEKNHRFVHIVHKGVQKLAIASKLE